MMETNTDLISAMTSLGQKAKTAAMELACASGVDKNRWLNSMADSLDKNMEVILSANAEDMKNAKEAGLSQAKLDRLFLNEARVHAMADALRHVVTLPDPCGRLLSRENRPNGLVIDKVSVPLGVIGIVYEARPNVTADAAGLCLKAGNAVILRGGSEAMKSNLALSRILADAGEAAGMPANAIQQVSVKGHEAVSVLLKLDKYIDLVIPRGGERLIRAVVEQSTIPVLKHYKGLCHIFADADCDQERALDIIENAKCQRPGVCNALETLLIHRDVAKELLPKIVDRLKSKGVELRGCPECLALCGEDMKPATEEDWSTEYLDLILSVKIVGSVKEAVDHINHYSSHHSESILTKNAGSASYFLDRVDSAAVYENASTRFTDGGEFGMGAEIGISTDKLHARGPMGLPELNSYKYKIHGNGQIR